MDIAVCLQSVTVVDRQVTFTGTSTRISSMVMALWLQSVTVCRQATFTDHFARISSMEVTLYLQSVAVMDLQATLTDTSTRISSSDTLQSVAIVDQ